MCFKKLDDSKTKPVKAKDLYVSPLFTKAWKYATNAIKADEIYVLAGAKYYKYLIPERRSNIRFIYEGKRIGEILHFLDQQKL